MLHEYSNRIGGTKQRSSNTSHTLCHKAVVYIAACSAGLTIGSI